MKLHIEITRQDYYDFNKFHFIKTKLKSTIIRGIILIVIMQIILNIDGFDLIPTLFSTIVAGSLYFISINRALNKIKNIPDDGGAILGEKEVEFGEDHIIYKSKNSQSMFDWNSIKNIQESTNAFYLYQDSTMAIVIPKRFFKNEEETEVFRKMIHDLSKRTL